MLDTHTQARRLRFRNARDVSCGPMPLPAFTASGDAVVALLHAELTTSQQCSKLAALLGECMQSARRSLREAAAAWQTALLNAVVAAVVAALTHKLVSWKSCQSPAAIATDSSLCKSQCPALAMEAPLERLWRAQRKNISAG